MFIIAVVGCPLSFFLISLFARVYFSSQSVTVLSRIFSFEGKTRSALINRDCFNCINRRSALYQKACENVSHGILCAMIKDRLKLDSLFQDDHT